MRTSPFAAVTQCVSPDDFDRKYGEVVLHQPPVQIIRFTAYLLTVLLTITVHMINR